MARDRIRTNAKTSRKRGNRKQHGLQRGRKHGSGSSTNYASVCRSKQDAVTGFRRTICSAVSRTVTGDQKRLFRMPLSPAQEPPTALSARDAISSAHAQAFKVGDHV